MEPGAGLRQVHPGAAGGKDPHRGIRKDVKKEENPKRVGKKNPKPQDDAFLSRETEGQVETTGREKMTDPPQISVTAQRV